MAKQDKGNMVYFKSNFDSMGFWGVNEGKEGLVILVFGEKENFLVHKMWRNAAISIKQESNENG